MVVCRLIRVFVFTDDVYDKSNESNFSSYSRMMKGTKVHYPQLNAILWAAVAGPRVLLPVQDENVSFVGLCCRF